MSTYWRDIISGLVLAGTIALGILLVLAVTGALPGEPGWAQVPQVSGPDAVVAADAGVVDAVPTEKAKRSAKRLDDLLQQYKKTK